MIEDEPLDEAWSREPFDLAAIKQRAHVRLMYPRGRFGDPVPWCDYCGVKLPGETQQEHESVIHEPSCPVTMALARRGHDFDRLVAEVERLQGRYES
jgi:hypothetical protein